MVLGEGGILDMAKQAAEKTNQAIVNEQGDMANLVNDIENILGNNQSPTPKGISPDEIKGKETEFYGKTVNYTSTNNTGVTKWRIFYAGKLDDEDETEQSHIYLIADDYISVDNTPQKNGNKLSGTSYSLSFGTDLIDCYSGATDIYKNGTGKVRNMLKQYFDYTKDNNTYPNRVSKNPNIKAVAYMLDTEIWSNLYGDEGENAEYAIGGPPLEMFVKSYKETHSDSNIGCEVTNTNGYNYSNATNLKNDYDSIYIKSDDSKCLRRVARVSF